jgi:hypothetical protein
MPLTDNVFVRYAFKRTDGGDKPKFYGYLPPFGRYLNNNQVLLLDDGFWTQLGSVDKKSLEDGVAAGRIEFSTIGIMRIGASNAGAVIDININNADTIAVNGGVGGNALQTFPYAGKIIAVYAIMAESGICSTTGEYTLTLNVTKNGTTVFSTKPLLHVDLTGTDNYNGGGIVSFGTDATSSQGITKGILKTDATILFEAGDIFDISGDVSTYAAGGGYAPDPSNLRMVVEAAALL